MRTLITDESKPLNLKTYKSPSSDNTHFSQPCSIARNSNRHISNESLSLSVTTTISQFHQQLTLKPLAPIRYPGIMKKSDKHFPNSRRSVRKSNLTQSPETASATKEIMMKRKNGKTKLLFQQLPFNRTHTVLSTPAENSHPESNLRLIPYVCA